MTVDMSFPTMMDLIPSDTVSQNKPFLPSYFLLECTIKKKGANIGPEYIHILFLRYFGQSATIPFLLFISSNFYYVLEVIKGLKILEFYLISVKLFYKTYVLWSSTLCPRWEEGCHRSAWHPMVVTGGPRYDEAL